MEYLLIKDGDIINRVTKEFWGDTDADIKAIPKSELVPYSFGIAINNGNIRKWVCNSKKEWYEWR